jgi:hypothetical protein
MERAMVCPYVKSFIRIDLYMIWKNQVFIANVVVIYLMQEMVALNVISRLANVVVELNTITKIRKYKRLHEGHHFILMIMEVHGELEHDMDHFIKKCVCLFQNKRSWDHLSLSFCI